jgi:RimJ/RimL family protein N-acetyltransferase
MVVLATSLADLTLRSLEKADARALHDLVQENRRHLTALGDYAELVSMPFEKLDAELANAATCNLRFGIFLGGTLIGSADLIPVDPPRYGLGYWLATDATGKGYATAAVGRLVAFAREDLAASDIYAGVTHGNHRSQALLARLGFLPVAEFESYTRYHCALSPAATASARPPRSTSPW